MTDINGNKTGNINPNDWNLKKLSDATVFDQQVFQQFQESQNKGTSGFNLKNYKQNCNLPTKFTLTAFPNPMIGSDCWLNFKLQTNLHFMYGIEIYADKFGKVFQVLGFPEKGIWQSKVNALTVHDFIYYGLFVTSDSCLYYTKGNVIGCDL